MLDGEVTRFKVKRLIEERKEEQDQGREATSFICTTVTVTVARTVLTPFATHPSRDTSLKAASRSLYDIVH